MDHELGERERARRWDPHDDILQEINEEEEEDGEEGNGEFIGA